ncbi:MAG TPA: glycosyltransferase family 39 protein [Vicinamibacterales bacterium]|nr:glycosyltransferase family 39 protein [Vicinamibacterales bacterium]HPW20176.1 glycosyltransferase family 39 protein [Vicinamibacterales bacterium]
MTGLVRWLAADGGAEDIDERTYRLALALTAVVAVLLRMLFPLADPPWQMSVGVVWHDEGAWTHNARNMALFGTWETDRWNPMYLAPVFTALEYASFRAFGVGLWQARFVPEILGAASVLFLAGAVRHAAGRAAGALAGALASVHFVWVMWNRAALLETPMVVPMVAALYACARGARAGGWRAAAWGASAGACAVIAFFAKAAAAFFLPALGVVALAGLWRWHVAPADARAAERSDLAHRGVILGLLLAGATALVVFVIPFWSEFRFYNWQMSVTRKPSYAWAAFVDRASWLPVVTDFFTRMWVVLLLAFGAACGVAARWRRAAAAEWLAVAWIVLGCAELIVHDTGNERRYVFLIPPLIALASIALGRDRRLVAPEVAALTRRQLVAVLPVVLFGFYVLAGSAARAAFAPHISPSVRSGAAAAALAGAALAVAWPRPVRWISSRRWTLRASVTLAALVVGLDLAGFVRWSAGRTYHNYRAMRLVGERLAPGTLVHGKLANGLALESRIRPVFVGREFGNYEDRLERDDIRYILTYTRPYLGYEGRVILDVLGATAWTVVERFPVAESPAGNDEAALIEKLPRAGSGTPAERR